MARRSEEVSSQERTFHEKFFCSKKTMTIIRFISILPSNLDLLMTDTDCQAFDQIEEQKEPRSPDVALPDR